MKNTTEIMQNVLESSKFLSCLHVWNEFIGLFLCAFVYVNVG